MNTKKIVLLFLCCLGFSLPVKAVDVSGLIYNVNQQQRTFELEGNRYQVPKAIPIKYSRNHNMHFEFTQIGDGTSLKVRFARGNAGVRTVIEALLQPL